MRVTYVGHATVLIEDSGSAIVTDPLLRRRVGHLRRQGELPAPLPQLDGVLMPTIRTLRDTLDARAQAFSSVVMVGRTHLQDATPLTLGQVISGWGAQLDQALDGLGRALPGVCALAIGGTAVGVLIIGVLRNGLNLLGVSPFIQQVVIGVVIALAVATDTWRRRSQ